MTSFKRFQKRYKFILTIAQSLRMVKMSTIAATQPLSKFIHSLVNRFLRLHIFLQKPLLILGVASPNIAPRHVSPRGCGPANLEATDFWQ